MSQGQRFEILETPRLENPCLIAGWNQDVAGLGIMTLEFLVNKLNAKEFARIKPEGFFHLAGVLVERNVIQFPQSRFYFSKEHNLLIFHSDCPGQSHYEFMTTLLDITGQTGVVKEMYTIGGIVSLMAHTSPRRVSSVVNEPQLRQSLAKYDINTNLEYETPVGARPTLSSFFLWMAQQRKVTGANLWVDVPFYLAAQKDYRACKQMLLFFDQRFNLGLDFTDLDRGTERQNMLIAQLKEQEGDVHKYITMLERGIMLSEKESEALATKVAEILQKTD